MSEGIFKKKAHQPPKRSPTPSKPAFEGDNIGLSACYHGFLLGTHCGSVAKAKHSPRHKDTDEDQHCHSSIVGNVGLICHTISERQCMHETDQQSFSKSCKEKKLLLHRR